MTNPLIPVVSVANQAIPKADAPAFLASIAALTPVPTGTTIDKLTLYTVTVKADGSLQIRANFKS